MREAGDKGPEKGQAVEGALLDLNPEAGNMDSQIVYKSQRHIQVAETYRARNVFLGRI
jgi:hypothetical protein